jgi:hypothetical protein
MAKKNSLGRGLGALIEEAEPEVQKVVGGTKVDIRLVDANPFQPRTVFDQEALEELTTSIKELGVIQPITVRETETGRYQLITGVSGPPQRPDLRKYLPTYAPPMTRACLKWHWLKISSVKT